MIIGGDVIYDGVFGCGPVAPHMYSVFLSSLEARTTKDDDWGKWLTTSISELYCGPDPWSIYNSFFFSSLGVITLGDGNWLGYQIPVQRCTIYA